MRNISSETKKSFVVCTAILLGTVLALILFELIFNRAHVYWSKDESYNSCSPFEDCQEMETCRYLGFDEPLFTFPLFSYCDHTGFAFLGG